MRKALKIFCIVATGALLLCAAWLIWRYYPLVKSLTQPENMEIFRVKLRSLGVWGAAALLGIQILQVLSGVIPALPIQLGAGITYGALGGLAICLCGILAGSTVVFLAMKRFGQPLLDRVFPKEKQQKLAFLRDADELSLIVFIIYLIPAMPKDVLTYAAALTPLTLRRFLMITLVARTPTILGNTYASAALLAGNNFSAILTFCITSTLGLLCMLTSKRILAWLRRRGGTKNAGES